MLLALDISLTTGVAWGGAEGGVPRSCVWALPVREENLDRALSSLREAVMGLCKFEKVEIVCIEAAGRYIDSQSSAYAAFLLISLSAVAREAAYRHGARVVPVSVGTWRKHWLGSGNLPGHEAKRRAVQRCEQLGWPAKDHNAAEACGIWAWGMAQFYPKWRPQ